MTVDADGFVARWARRKARVQSGIADPLAAPAGLAGVAAPFVPTQMPGTAPPLVRAPLPGAEQPLVAPPMPGTAPPLVRVETAPVATGEPPPLPLPLPTMNDVARLTRASDYSRFVLPGVDEGVKNAAMKKLFTDPHFNVMDGLDTYIDDYGKPDPIPIAMLRQMNQAKFLGLFDDEDEGEGEGEAAALVASINGASSAAVAQSVPLEESGSLSDERATRAEPHPDDDPDLRLQQDDAPGRTGADPGPRA